MSAAADHRKRLFHDLDLSSSSLSGTAFSRKPRFLPRGFSPFQRHLRHHFLAPQRNLKPCGLGLARATSIPKKVTRLSMGSYFSRLFGEKPQILGDGVGSEKDLGLGVYRRWVEEGARDVADLTVATREPAESRVVRRRVGDVRKAALGAAPVSEARELEKKVPFYKEEHERVLRRHNGKLSSLQSELRLHEEKLAGLRKASDSLARKPKEDLDELFTPLNDEEENKVYDALYGSGRSNKILVVHERSNIEITKEILQCLRPGGWLNDEVINLYLELLKAREEREPKRFLKCHFFNTFFYKKLNNGRTGYDYKAVRRWTTHKKLGYGLIECEKIFVPVHKDIHWCLAIINMKDKTLQYLDSLGGFDSNALRVLARYIMDEVTDKSNIDIDTSSWLQESVDSLPLQQNGWDCGMFMLKYIDFYSRGLKLSFGQEHMEYFRKRTAKEILILRAG